MLRWSQALWASLLVYLQLVMRGQRSILLKAFEVNGNHETRWKAWLRGLLVPDKRARSTDQLTS